MGVGMRRRGVGGWGRGVAREAERGLVRAGKRDTQVRMGPSRTSLTRVSFPCCIALSPSCVIDTSPREFSAENCSMLANFGEMVVREIEKERQIQDQKVKNQV